MKTFIRLFYADTTIGAKLTLDANDGTKTLKDLKADIKEAKGDLVSMTEQFGAMSPEAAKAAEHLAELNEHIKDANKLTQAFNPDTKFHAFGASIQTVVGGFTALQGAMGLIGVESSELQKQLLKVQSALALSQGIAQLQEGIKTFKNLGTVIQQTTVYQKANNAATTAAAAIMRLFGVSVGQTSIAFNVLKGAIAATGIGLLIVGIGQMVQLFDHLINSAKEANELKQKALEQNIQFIDKQLQGEMDKISQQRELELAREKEKGASEQRLFEIEQKWSRIKLAALKRADDESNSLGEFHNQIVKAQKEEEVKMELNKINTIIKLNEKAKEDEKKRQAQAIKDAIEENRLRREHLFDNKPGNIQLPKDPEIEATEARMAANKKEFDQKKELRAQNVIDEKDKTFDLLNLSYIREKDAENEYQTRKTYLEAISETMGSLITIVGKQTAAGKVLGVAQATINTWIGVSEVLRAKSVLPEPFGTISKIINAGAIVTTGINAVKNILKTPVPGFGGDGSAPPAIDAPLTPQAQTPINTNTSLNADSLNALGAANTRAYVLETDIANNRERIERLNRAARLG